MQWTADGSVLYQELSPSRKDRYINVAPIGGTPRTLWKDHEPKYWTPQAREAKIVVSPDGKLVAFPSDRTGWIHVYVIPANATAESQGWASLAGCLGAVTAMAVTKREWAALGAGFGAAALISVVLR